MSMMNQMNQMNQNQMNQSQNQNQTQNKNGWSASWSSNPPPKPTNNQENYGFPQNSMFMENKMTQHGHFKKNDKRSNDCDSTYKDFNTWNPMGNMNGQGGSWNVNKYGWQSKADENWSD